MNVLVQQSDEAAKTAPQGREPQAVGGPRGTQSPQRRCIVSRAVLDKSDLLRFVIGPDDTVVFDAAGKLPGRGLWLCNDRKVLAQACAKRSFAKAARAAVTVPEDLVETVERTLRRRCLEGLGLARRAGLVDLGFEKVRARVAAGRVLLVLQAGDAAEGGRQKVAALARAMQPAPVMSELFDAAALGQSLGRDSVVHVALCQGGMARRVLTEVERLGTFMDGGPADRQSGAGSARSTDAAAQNA